MNRKIQGSGCKLQFAGFRQSICSLQSAIRNSKAGFTLIEIIVVVAIIGTLLTIAGLEVSGWLSNYKVETEIKNMYVDLMNARARAMQRNRVHFVTLTTTQYKTYEDIYPAPDGDGQLTTGGSDCLCSSTCSSSDCRVMQKDLDARYPIVWNGSGNEIDFLTTGLSNVNKTICSNTDFISANPSPSGADYDCIIISTSRINLGCLATSIPDGGVCDSSNCVAK